MFPLYLIMLLVLTFYLLDCLYAERKDRSILFWKSLPVSDGLTVLSKFLVAVVVVPLGVLVLAAACHVLLFLVWQLGVATGRLPDVLTWSTVLWFKVEAAMLASLVLGALWYAPVAAAFLVVSAWARRSPIMWVTLAPIVAMVVEWKIGTHYVAHFLYYRTFGIWEVLGMGHSERLDQGASTRGGPRGTPFRCRLHQSQPVARGAGDGRAAVRRGARAPLPGRHRRLSRGRRGALPAAPRARTHRADSARPPRRARPPSPSARCACPAPALRRRPGQVPAPRPPGATPPGQARLN